MDEQQSASYAAIIKISLPDAPEGRTVQVELLPADEVPVNGRYKRLYECTLADLQLFGDQLEAEVWETVQDIRLFDLARDQAADISMTVIDENGVPVIPPKEWFQQAMVQTSLVEEVESLVSETETETETADTAPARPELEEIPVAAEAEAGAEEPGPSPATDEPVAEPVLEDEIGVAKTAVLPAASADEIQINILDSQPVYPEDILATTLPGTTVVGDTYIQPSQARVRVAGKRLPLGQQTWAAVDILLDESALRSAQAHALSSLDREVAGVMIGPRPEKQPDGRYVVHVIDTILAKYTVMQGASVTYTPESWRYMNDKLAERYPDETAVIVGWYHTHPGFGIFLSGMDQFIHQNFFTQKWHIAYVLDPRARTSGFFCWDKTRTRVSPYEFQWPSWAQRTW